VTSRKWVVNASPVIVLADIDCLHLLEGLCTELVIPAAVAREIRAGPREDAAQRWLEGHVQAYIRHLEDVDPTIVAWDLGAGESQVLTCAP